MCMDLSDQEAMTAQPINPNPQDAALAASFTGCVASAIRQADRLVASVFDDKLRDIGLRGTQLTLLGAVATLGHPNQRDLADTTHTDPTTLSRNLDRLLERGLVDRIECEQDRRMRRYALTEAGRKTLNDALPLWRAAQQEVTRRLGVDLCDTLRRASAILSES